MFSYIKGKLDRVNESSIILENNGIGYFISVPTSTAAKLFNVTDEVKLYTHLNVKEDEISLFGFLSQEEYNMFRLLVSVSGIGPKIALGALSSMSAEQLATAIVSDDSAALSRAPGVGKKTAGRIILELKDRMKKDIPVTQQSIDFAVKEKLESIEALVALGYNRREAMKAVHEVYADGMTTEQTIKLSLKKIVSYL